MNLNTLKTRIELNNRLSKLMRRHVPTLKRIADDSVGKKIILSSGELSKPFKEALAKHTSGFYGRGEVFITHSPYFVKVTFKNWETVDGFCEYCERSAYLLQVKDGVGEPLDFSISYPPELVFSDVLKLEEEKRELTARLSEIEGILVFTR